MRLAILGLGSMGLKHAENARAQGCTVIGFDPDSAALAKLESLGGLCVESAGAAIQQSESVVIASPPACHLDHIAAALAAGRPTLVEKPLSDRVGDLVTLLSEAEQRGTVVAVAQNLRFHPAVNAARTMLADGAIGQPVAAVAIGVSHLPDWRPGRDYRVNYAADPKSGGAIFDWIHEVDLMAYLFGPFESIAAAAGRSGALEISAEDTATMALRHNGGVASTVMVSYIGGSAKRTTDIFGTDGRLEIDIPARRLRAWNRDGRETVQDFGGRHGDDYGAELSDFLLAATGKVQPRCTALEALDILRQVLRLRALAGLPTAESSSESRE